jgi:hypothetical protein
MGKGEWTLKIHKETNIIIVLSGIGLKIRIVVDSKTGLK